VSKFETLREKPRALAMPACWRREAIVAADCQVALPESR
jgi:hypothetical protein